MRKAGPPQPGSTHTDESPTRKTITMDRTTTPPTGATSTAATAAVLVAFGEYFPPAGRRHLGAILIRRCPGCSHAHFHRGSRVASVDGESRTGSCGTEYRVRVLPAARVGGAA